MGSTLHPGGSSHGPEPARPPRASSTSPASRARPTGARSTTWPESSKNCPLSPVTGRVWRARWHTTECGLLALTARDEH
jgi:hypothetical protein